jgi:hypothetical protein
MAVEHNYCSACGNATKKGLTNISSGKRSVNTIGSEIKDSPIHIGDNYTVSNDIDPSNLNIQRHFVSLPWSNNGKLGNSSSIFKLGTWGSLASIVSLLLPDFTSLNYPSFWGLLGLCLSALLVIFAEMLNEQRFKHFLGLKNLEVGTGNGIYLTEITCDCPWCEAQMKLGKVGSDYDGELLLVCKRNSRQHRIIFDPTIMPNIEE